jgi:hypothetical protein
MCFNPPLFDHPEGVISIGTDEACAARLDQAVCHLVSPAGCDVWLVEWQRKLDVLVCHHRPIANSQVSLHTAYATVSSAAGVRSRTLAAVV